MKKLLDYESAIQHAKELLSEQIRDPEGEENPEYMRGIVEYICEACGIGMEFKDTVTRCIMKADQDDSFVDRSTQQTDVDKIIMGK